MVLHAAHTGFSLISWKLIQWIKMTKKYIYIYINSDLWLDDPFKFTLQQSTLDLQNKSIYITKYTYTQYKINK